ncbi:transglutaminase domain-containing protein [Oscillochloris trichoides DG-6]|uniref:Transglutaminase domain-containing protein n=1 Tax=Oscillochloris trichoides DG-6 TaxID=765420 RepID=E1IE35_9CHLR|nr:transglutaminase domain-containing protein [Oscillochloris trichoides DG-6]
MPGVSLALIMCAAVIHSLAISGWAPGLAVLVPMSLPGFLLGVVFARIRWMPGWVAHLLSIPLSLVWAIHLLGDQMSPVLHTWRDQAVELFIRTLIWARVMGAGGRGEDLLLFVAVLCMLSWALLYDSAWQLFRYGRTWRTIIVNALVFLINYTYVLPKPDLPFFVFLAAALLLLVHQHIVQRQALWDAQQMEYPDLLPLRFLWSAMLVCGLLITGTAFVPGSISVDRANQTWEALRRPFTLARERWEDAFSTLNAPAGAGSGAFAARNAQLGGARQLNDGLVMTVRATSFDYWRGVAFDKYSDGRWQNTTGEQARAALGLNSAEAARTSLAPGEPIPLTATRGRQRVDLAFTLVQDRNDDLLFVGGNAESFSIPALLEHNFLRDTDPPSPNYDDTALIATPNELRSGTTYTVTALISRIDVESLRNAGTDYPAWVVERYLQVPETLTARTREQAAQIIAEAGAQNAYDQAIAIQTYLRTFRYNEAIPGPPVGAEPVDWFLFTQREGYCDYYASAMVLMLRSVGVPARWVQGYAGGVFNAENGVYEVRENVAHSWPEVYFPGIGWERFEPTPASYAAGPWRPLTSVFGTDGEDGPDPVPSSLPADLDQPEELDPGLEPSDPSGAMQNTSSPSPTPASRDLGPWPLLIAGSVGSLALLALLIYARWRYELRGLSRNASAYAAMELLAAWGGHPQPAQHTPQEYAHLLSDLHPAHRSTIQQISHAYQSERYHQRRLSLPAPEDERALYMALIRRIFDRRRGRP